MFRHLTSERQTSLLCRCQRITEALYFLGSEVTFARLLGERLDLVRRFGALPLRIGERKEGAKHRYASVGEDRGLSHPTLNVGDVLDRDGIDGPGSERRNIVAFPHAAILARCCGLASHIDVGKELFAEGREPSNSLLLGRLTSGVLPELDASKVSLDGVSTLLNCERALNSER
jgi:hypothetical protein